MTKELALQIIEALHNYARAYDYYEMGLPSMPEQLDEMVELVIAVVDPPVESSAVENFRKFQLGSNNPEKVRVVQSRIDRDARKIALLKKYVYGRR